VRLFYISPWAHSSPLTASTVVPHLAALVALDRVEEVHFIAPAEGPESAEPFDWATTGMPMSERLILRTFKGRPSRPTPWSRLSQHRDAQQMISRLALECRPGLVVCRGTASIFGHQLWVSQGIPYAVESFEPHAQYMRQTGTWRWYDPKYLLQSRWESKVKRSAKALVTVSRGYAAHLQSVEGVERERLFCVPCWVDPKRFHFDPEARQRTRRMIGADRRTVAIYAGKFGGIYHPVDVLRSLLHLRPVWGEALYVAILTDHDPRAVRAELAYAGFAEQDVFVARVPHKEVNDFLSASDFALSFINAGPWSFACSAVKHGEYWAAGLPILMPAGVGDERLWLESRAAGAFVDFACPNAVTKAGMKIAHLLEEPGLRERLYAVALEERSDRCLRSTYKAILDNVQAD
jgi:hypothetical protein